MMAEKFAVLDRPIRCRDPQKVTNIIKSVCILHNFVRSREGIQYKPQHFETTDFTPESIPAPQNLQIFLGVVIVDERFGRSISQKRKIHWHSDSLCHPVGHKKRVLPTDLNLIKPRSKMNVRSI
ncbi:hypothetical protein evm_013427 [Chilo suppressalis]|nr:hypothetical protein evm_013427 [Chilo suppressalis]